MPIRLVDGDKAWEADKLADCRQEYVPHYFMLLPLALANGSFECSPRDITRRVYGKTMPAMTRGQVELILGEFKRVKLLFVWKAEDGKLWGFWTKIEGRLPAVSQVKKGHYGLGAPVPIEELAEFLGKNVDEVRADLEGTAAVLGAHDVGRRGVSRHGRDDGKAMARKDQDGIRTGLGGVSDPAPAAPSPTAPPPQAQGAQESKKKIRGTESVKTGTGVEANPSLVAYDFALFAVRFRECAGLLPGGSPKKRELYRALCGEFGELAVLDAVPKWAAQRGGAARLWNNVHAVWDFLEHGQCRAEILGSRGQGKSTLYTKIEDRMRKHREVDAETRELLAKGLGGGS